MTAIQPQCLQPTIMTPWQEPEARTQIWLCGLWNVLLWSRGLNLVDNFRNLLDLGELLYLGVWP